MGVEGNLLFRVFFLPQKIGDLDEAELIEIPLDQVKTKEKTKLIEVRDNGACKV